MTERSKSNTTSGREEVLRLEEFLPYQLNQLAEAVSQSFSRIYADQFGITIPEWRVIAILGEGRSKTARDIGRASNMHKTKVSRAVSALESKGLLQRSQSKDDQREHLLDLSEKGKAVYQDLVPQAVAYSNALFDALDDVQQRQLREIFARLTKAANSPQRPPD